jgi:hypothetical protein
MRRPDGDRENVLRELDQLAKGEHTTQQTPLKRYMLCPNWQKAAALVRDALHSSQRKRGGTRLLAPPASLPPV